MKTKTETSYMCEECKRSYSESSSASYCEDLHKRQARFENIKTFELKQEHLDLLKNTNIDWNDCEFGAPEIDPKRPYGNSDVKTDIAEIIKLRKKGNWNSDEECWNDEIYETLSDLHKETQLALQIILHCQTFKLGKYKLSDKGWQSWKYVENIKA